MEQPWNGAADPIVASALEARGFIIAPPRSMKQSWNGAADPIVASALEARGFVMRLRDRHRSRRATARAGWWSTGDA
jgi:hypothetical protein